MLKSTAVQFEVDYSDRLSIGIELLEEKKFDVLLLDLGLPDSQGLETLKKARAKARGIPFVVLTSVSDEEIGIKAVQEGAQDYLIKGHVDGDLLVRAIRYAIERKRAEEELWKAHDELERRVEERTAELVKANNQLATEIAERNRIENVNLARLRLLQFADTHTLDELLQATMDEAEALTGSLIGFYHFLEADQKTLWLQNWSTRTKAEFCTAEGKGLHYEVDKAGVWVDCIYQRTPVIHNDYASLIHRKGLPPGHAPVIRELVVPVIRGERIMAIFGVGNKPEDYTEQDIETVSLLADLAWEIADRKRAEEALQKSEEKYRTVADFTYDWEDWLDPYGKYIYVSPSCEWITGYPADEFVSDPDLVIKITHPVDRDLVEEHFREILRGSIAIHHIDFRIITRSGEERWISHYCQPVYGKDGNFLGRRSSNRDITNRKEDENELRQLTNDLERLNIELSTTNDQLKTEIEIRIKTEKELKESEERYKRMVSAVTVYTYSVDLSYAGAISTRHSVGCIPVTGYNPEDFEADPYLWHSMIYPDDRMMVENSLKEILAGHKVSPIEHRIIRHDGKVVWVRNTVAPHYDGDGRLICYDGLIEDITERKRAEEEIQKLNKKLEQHILELTEANKELDAFNYSVSHDLKAPLIIIGGFIRRFLKDYRNKLDTKEKDIFNAIQIYVQKMERLIKDLLAFSRSGRQQIKPVEIDIGNLVTTVLNELKPLSDGRMIKFDIKTLPPAYGDIALIKQVFANILSNAIKFTTYKKLATIEVGGWIEENENIYYTKDNGIGFDSQDSDELFSVFKRLHGDEGLEGTGVGLSIVQRIVNRHGGRVWAEGKVNEGATFYFSLPKESLKNS